MWSAYDRDAGTPHVKSKVQTLHAPKHNVKQKGKEASHAEVKRHMQNDGILEC